MYHSAGCTIEQTNQHDGMASASAKGILSSGRGDRHSRELCKIQLVNIASFVDTCMCNLIEKGNAGIKECKNVFHFCAQVFHMARLCIKQSSSSMLRVVKNKKIYMYIYKYIHIYIYIYIYLGRGNLGFYH